MKDTWTAAPTVGLLAGPMVAKSAGTRVHWSAEWSAVESGPLLELLLVAESVVKSVAVLAVMSVVGWVVKLVASTVVRSVALSAAQLVVQSDQKLVAQTVAQSGWRMAEQRESLWAGSSADQSENLTAVPWAHPLGILMAASSAVPRAGWTVEHLVGRWGQKLVASSVNWSARRLAVLKAGL